MSYSSFTIPKAIEKLGIVFQEKQGCFSHYVPLAISEILKIRLSDLKTIGFVSETARLAFLVAPIVLEVVNRYPDQTSLYLGATFDVDSSQGLKGIADGLIGLSNTRVVVTSPVIAVVEAKKHELDAAYGACIAEMVAARIFNEKNHCPISTYYAIATTGKNWQFLTLKDNIVTLDSRVYFDNEIEQILGIIDGFIKQGLQELAEIRKS